MLIRALTAKVHLIEKCGQKAEQIIFYSRYTYVVKFMGGSYTLLNTTQKVN